MTDHRYLLKESAAWKGCRPNGSDAHFHTQHVSLQIGGSVNHKRLLTRESVSSRHNTDSSEPSGVRREHDETPRQHTDLPSVSVTDFVIFLISTTNPVLVKYKQ